MVYWIKRGSARQEECVCLTAVPEFHATLYMYLTGSMHIEHPHVFAFEAAPDAGLRDQKLFFSSPEPKAPGQLIV